MIYKNRKASNNIKKISIVTNSDIAYNKLLYTLDEMLFISVLKINSKGILNELGVRRTVKKADLCFFIIDFRDEDYTKFIDKSMKISNDNHLTCVYLGINRQEIKDYSVIKQIHKKINTLIFTDTESIIDTINCICDLNRNKEGTYVLDEFREYINDKSVGYTSVGEGKGKKRWQKALIDAINDFPSREHFSVGKNIMLTIDISKEDAQKDILFENLNDLVELLRIVANKHAKISFTTLTNNEMENMVGIRIFANGYNI